MKHSATDAFRGMYRKLLGATLLCLFCLPIALAAPGNYAQQLPGVVHSEFLDVKLAGTRLVAAGERGHIVYSDDNGESWTQAQVPTTVMLTRLFFITAKTGWVVGHDGNILVTSDGGTHWEMQRHGLTSQGEINEKNLGRTKERVRELQAALKKALGSDEEPVLKEQLDEAEFALEDAKEIMKEAVYPPPLMDVWFRDEQHGFASGAYGTLLYTTNGGRKWLDWAHTVQNPDELHLNGIAGDTEGKLYIASEWGTIFRSNDWGESWDPVETGYEGSFFGILYNPLSQSVFAYGLRGNIYRSTDTGLNWTALQSRARASLFGASVNSAGRMVFVGSGGTITSSTNDGEDFKLSMQANRRGLTGVAQLENGLAVVAGAGGNQIVALPREATARATQAALQPNNAQREANPSH